MLFFLLACTAGDDSASKDTENNGTDPTGDAVCTEPTEVSCVDEMVSDLTLHDDKVSEDEVSNEADGAGWSTYIDASAGGYQNASKNPWVYVKFTPDGAVRVDLDDESALESMDWDLAAHRYVLRLNGGSSGPSCVGAAVLGEGYTYENTTEVPAGATYQLDDFYTEDCSLINDSSGLEGSPQTALSSWWDYPGCVATTGQAFLIQLADGQVIKFVVDAYYGGNGQEECNENNSTMESGGFYQVRWQFM